MPGGFGGIGVLLWIGLVAATIWWIAQAASQKSQPEAPVPAARAPWVDSVRNAGGAVRRRDLGIHLDLDYPDAGAGPVPEGASGSLIDAQMPTGPGGPMMGPGSDATPTRGDRVLAGLVVVASATLVAAVLLLLLGPR